MAKLLSLAPILSVGDLERTAGHYRALGFSVTTHDSGYATASRDGLKLHFHEVGEPMAADAVGAVYFGVDDVEALHAEWSAAVGGETSDLFDPGFGVIEAAHSDPDGNIIRFGAPKV